MGRARNFRPAINREGKRHFREKCFEWGDAPALSPSYLFLLLLLLVEKERREYFGRLLAKKSTDASQRVIGRHVEEIYIYRPFCRSWLSTSHRINVSLRLSSPSPALQPSPPSIFSDPCGSTRSGTRDGYPSGHQT